MSPMRRNTVQDRADTSITERNLAKSESSRLPEGDINDKMILTGSSDGVTGPTAEETTMSEFKEPVVLLRNTGGFQVEKMTEAVARAKRILASSSQTPTPAPVGVVAAVNTSNSGRRR